VTVGELLNALKADYRLRQVKSLAQVTSHVKRIREHFGIWQAAGLGPRTSRFRGVSGEPGLMTSFGQTHEAPETTVISGA
jgi:hypothetical protein